VNKDHVMVPNPALPAALRVFDGINSGDFEGLEAMVTDDFVDHGSPFPVAPGPEGYLEVLRWVHGSLRLTYELHDVIETEGRIIVRATGSGVGAFELHGPLAAGRPFAMATIHIYRTEGDRLAEHWGVRDDLGAMIQMGAVPAPA
jgi:predicted ester cyclase